MAASYHEAAQRRHLEALAELKAMEKKMQQQTQQEEAKATATAKGSSSSSRSTQRFARTMQLRAKAKPRRKLPTLSETRLLSKARNALATSQAVLKEFKTPKAAATPPTLAAQQATYLKQRRQKAEAVLVSPALARFHASLAGKNRRMAPKVATSRPPEPKGAQGALHASLAGKAPRVLGPPPERKSRSPIARRKRSEVPAPASGTGKPNRPPLARRKRTQTQEDQASARRKLKAETATWSSAEKEEAADDIAKREHVQMGITRETWRPPRSRE